MAGRLPTDESDVNRTQRHSQLWDAFKITFHKTVTREEVQLSKHLELRNLWQPPILNLDKILILDWHILECGITTPENLCITWFQLPHCICLFFLLLAYSPSQQCTIKIHVNCKALWNCYSLLHQLLGRLRTGNMSYSFFVYVIIKCNATCNFISGFSV